MRKEDKIMLNAKTKNIRKTPLSAPDVAAGYWYARWQNASAVSILTVGLLIGAIVYYEGIEKKGTKKES